MPRDTIGPVEIRPGPPGRLIVRAPYHPEIVFRMKTVPEREWDRMEKHWTVTYARRREGRTAM